jgi:hypothetical protein
MTKSEQDYRSPLDVLVWKDAWVQKLQGALDLRHAQDTYHYDNKTNKIQQNWQLKNPTNPTEAFILHVIRMNEPSRDLHILSAVIQRVRLYTPNVMNTPTDYSTIEEVNWHKDGTVTSYFFDDINHMESRFDTNHRPMIGLHATRLYEDIQKIPLKS